MEMWKDVTNWEGLYKISNLGNVYSVRSNKNLKHQKSGHKGSGYLQVPLHRDGKKKLTCVHRLIAEHFIPNPENKPVVNHLDGNKQNNEISNLEWCTVSENMKHAYDTGLNTSLKHGIEHHKSKLNEDDVREIRRLYATGMVSQTKLAKQFGVNQANIGFIVRKEIWKHVE
jgi:hypothetical protein